eukprot:TRINITY_DN1744_c0_g3_i1.p1 TRINITY_DN1744_c0_g3~~TRINITY_DN1744_c0_g3_i1.p1  ORF type:complete len:113 (-),score=25.48 TRINITY_DN1744_c0_g3_i1:29-325(-)
MFLTFLKAERLEIVFSDEHSLKKVSLISVKFAKADKSTDSKDEHPKKKKSPMFLTFLKAERLEIVFSDEHSLKKVSLISVKFAKADKSTDSKDEHSIL